MDSVPSKSRTEEGDREVFALSESHGGFREIGPRSAKESGGDSTTRRREIEWKEECFRRFALAPFPTLERTGHMVNWAVTRPGDLAVKPGEKWIAPK